MYATKSNSDLEPGLKSVKNKFIHILVNLNFQMKYDGIPHINKDAKRMAYHLVWI